MRNNKFSFILENKSFLFYENISCEHFNKLIKDDVVGFIKINKGKGHFILNSKEINFSEKDIIIYKDNLIVIENENINLSAVLFSKDFFIYNLSLLDFVNNTKRNFSNILHNIDFSDILYEFQNEDIYYKEKILNYTEKILIDVNRYLYKNDFFKREIKKFNYTKSLKNIKKAIDFLEDNYFYTIVLDEIAEKAGLNPAYFSTLFKKVTGLTPMRYLIKIRIDHAKNYLSAKSDLTVAQIATRCGFYDMRYFHKLFKEYTGMTPNEYRKKYIKA